MRPSKDSDDAVSCDNCGNLEERYASEEEVAALRQENATKFLEGLAETLVKTHRDFLDAPHEDGETTEHPDEHLYGLVMELLESHLGVLGDIADAMAVQATAGEVQDWGMPWWLTRLTALMGDVASDIQVDELSHPGNEFSALAKNGGQLITFEPPGSKHEDVRESLLDVAALAAHAVTAIDHKIKVEEAEQKEAEEILENLREYVKNARDLLREDRGATLENDVLRRGCQAVRLLQMSGPGFKFLQELGIDEEHPLRVLANEALVEAEGGTQGELEFPEDD